jgi:fibronectin-binding autotransporter adhesin
MKTYSIKLQLPLTRLSNALAVLCLGITLQPSVQAQTQLSYTNTADAWLTTNSWTPANNWSSGSVRTNISNYNVRLNIGTAFNSNGVVTATYDASMGTTVLNNTNTGTPGLIICAGNAITGTVNITGGTLAIRNGTKVDGLLVGNTGTNEAGSATLTLSGGNLVFTNANSAPASIGGAVMCVGYRGGSDIGGPNAASGTFTVNSGSTALIDRIFYSWTTPVQTRAQNTGTINLNAGGTLITRNISARDNDTSQMASFFNFNGGTLRVGGPNIADLTVDFIRDAGTNLTLNVQSGGVVIDTAGVNVRVGKGLLDAGGGGGLTKFGAGTLTLSQTNTYTGPTVVNGGGLSFILPMSSSGLTLADGTTASITARDISWTNSVTSVTNAIINLALGAVTANPSATTAVINTGTLNVSGTNVINITSGSGLPNGTVKLIDYTAGGNRSGGGSFVLGTLAPGLQATLVDGPNDVSLNVTLSVQSLVWTAGIADWGTNGGFNWTNSAGVSSVYQEYPSGVGDVVNFTDAAGLFYTVNLTNNVKPAEVVLNHAAATAVTLTGVGQIAGTNGMTKTGTGTTLLSLSNSFSGVVSVNNGILQVDNGGALGSTAGVTAVSGTGTVMIGNGSGDGTTVTGETITISGAGFGGSLGALRGSIDPSGPNIWAGPIVLGSAESRIGTALGGNLTVAGPITDNGATNSLLYRPGDGGTIIVSNSAHSYLRTATFMGNTAFVKLGVNNGFSTNNLQVGPGNTDLNGFNQTISGLETYYGPGLLINNGAGTSTLTINVPGTNNYYASASIQGAIDLVKVGTGRQTLTTPTNGTASTYTGTTSVNEGDLRVDGVLTATAITVASGAILSGSGGSIDGTITINSGGTLAPGGDTIGVLTNTSTVTLNAGSTNLFRVDVGNTNLNDRLVANNLNYGGTLVVTNSGTTPLTNGQVFQLVSATTPTGTYVNAASVAILPGGTGTFAPATGELTVTTVPAVPTLNVVQSGNSLQFSWDQLNGVYRLQSQTNSLSTGLGTNWVNYFTGTTNPVTVPINAADPSVFFRLIAP